MSDYGSESDPSLEPTTPSTPSTPSSGNGSKFFSSAYRRVSRYFSSSSSSSGCSKNDNPGNSKDCSRQSTRSSSVGRLDMHSSSADNGATGTGEVTAASPGKQRSRGISARLLRWSQGKTDKSSGAQSPAAAGAEKKITSEKKIKIPFSGEGARDDGEPGSEDPEEPDVELPPPMKPIQDPQAVLQQAPTPSALPSNPPTRNSMSMDSLEANGGAADIAEIERIVKEKIVRFKPLEQSGGPSQALDGEGAAAAGEAALRSREHVLRELVDTEEVYVSDLRLVCEGYIRQMQDPQAVPSVPMSLRDCRFRMIFGNIQEIYDWHRNTFLPKVRGCVAAPEDLGPLFRRFIDKAMYETYCRNKPVSEYIVAQHEQYFRELRQKLGHRLQLADLLIKPIQRIQKYHLLMEKIHKYTREAHCPPAVEAAVLDALKYTEMIPKNANDMMDVRRLQGFEAKNLQGKLLMQEPLYCANITGNVAEKPKEMHVFLFEQAIIFSTAVGKKTTFTSPVYNYKAHIQVNKMELNKHKDGTFVLKSTDPNRPSVSYHCRAHEDRRQEWLSTLTSILRSQQEFSLILENPHMNDGREPARHSTASDGRGEHAPTPRARQRPHGHAHTINLPARGSGGNGGSVPPSPTSPPHANGLSKKSWGLKLRRGGDSVEGVVTELRAPELTEPLADVAAAAGGVATLCCRATATRAAASWRKTAPDTRALRHGGRFAISLAADGLATLTISAVRATDAGVYCCLVSNELGGVQSSARLTVNGGAPGVPAVRAHPAGGLVVQWDEPAPAHLEYCRVGEGEWRRATETPAAVNTLSLEELPGGQYSFRLVCARGVAGAASAPAACGAGGAWQREQFARRYAAEGELGRGRTARVLAARDTGTGQRVALKQVWSGRGADAAREYRILSRCAHGALVRALALFGDVPRAGVHTLVLELAAGGPLLEWAAGNPHQHTQRAAAAHAAQLLSALDWLHSNNVAHLDVRPENILVELGGPQPQLKLVDLGSAVELGGDEEAAGSAGGEVLPPAPAQLEFAPPECVLGRPPAPAWDAWAAGVFLYVFLTGLSPFLDESVEETTANIIKCDYCFPAEHWGGVDARAQRLIRGLLTADAERRTPPAAALRDSWFDEAPSTPLSATQLKTFLDRRRPAGQGGMLPARRSPSDT